MKSVEMCQITKAYRSAAVLRGVDLSVEQGSLTAVLGRSGSGKTTLLRLLAGFDAPDSGSISIDGEVVEDATHHTPPERRRIGYVPQDAALFPHLSVKDNVAFGLARRKDNRARVEETLELIGMASFANRQPHELSGGQQQRVALARALAPVPKLLLLDEPFSSLDAKMRTELRVDVAEVLAKTATTTILVTHDQDEALSLADHVAVLRRGHIAQVGPPRVIYEFPNNPRIAAFVGVANFVAGTQGEGVVRTPLGELSTRVAGEVVPSGRDVVALLRPEDLEMDFSGTGEGLQGEVEQIEYFGHDALVRLRMLNVAPGAVRAVFAPESSAIGVPTDKASVLIVRTHDASGIAPGAIGTVRCTSSVLVWPAPEKGRRSLEKLINTDLGDHDDPESRAS